MKDALAWPKDIPMGDSHPSTETMLNIRHDLKELINKYKILIWGLEDPIFPKRVIDW